MLTASARSARAPRSGRRRPRATRRRSLRAAATSPCMRVRDRERVEPGSQRCARVLGRRRRRARAAPRASPRAGALRQRARIARSRLAARRNARRELPQHVRLGLDAGARGDSRGEERGVVRMDGAPARRANSAASRVGPAAPLRRDQEAARSGSGIQSAGRVRESRSSSSDAALLGAGRDRARGSGTSAPRGRPRSGAVRALGLRERARDVARASASQVASAASSSRVRA